MQTDKAGPTSLHTDAASSSESQSYDKPGRPTSLAHRAASPDKPYDSELHATSVQHDNIPNLSLRYPNQRNRRTTTAKLRIRIVAACRRPQPLSLVWDDERQINTCNKTTFTTRPYDCIVGESSHSVCTVARTVLYMHRTTSQLPTEYFS